MLKQIYHVGLTVTDLERSVRFYRDVLGLRLKGRIEMEGESTERIFNRKGCAAKLAYLTGSDSEDAPTVELIEFTDLASERQEGSLFRTSISELCFYVEDAELTYRELKDQGVECLSEPQEFDFSKDGFGRSKAFYFKDPDGIVLEAMESLD